MGPEITDLVEFAYIFIFRHVSSDLNSSFSSAIADLRNYYTYKMKCATSGQLPSRDGLAV